MPIQRERVSEGAAGYALPERALLRTIMAKVRQHKRVPFAVYAPALGKLPLANDIETVRILGVSRATLQRARSEHSALDPVAGDRLARALRLKAAATDTFGSGEAANAWMTTPNPGLEGARPIDLASDDAGAQEVEMALWRVRDGIPA